MKKRRRQKKSTIKRKSKQKINKRFTSTPKVKITIFKKPTFLMVSSLIVIILLIPTLIVIIPTLKAEQKVVEQPTETVEVASDETEELVVPVMRTKIDEIENVPLEQYVTRVVASEMPAEFEIEALKAQALAARTFVINQLMNEQNSKDLAILDTVDHQVYNDEDELRDIFGTDYHWKIEKIEEAVVATKSEILTYEQNPITPAFFSTSNGYTENSEDYWESELPYLRSVESKWDEKSPKYISQHTFTIDEIEKLLNISLQRNTSIPIEISRTDSNRIKTLKIADQQFSGRKVRELLNLPSNDFSIEQRNDHFIFTTKGYGHGVGMSQYGANGMAKEGKNYKEIVSYYYKGVNIKKFDEIAPTLVEK